MIVAVLSNRVINITNRYMNYAITPDGESIIQIETQKSVELGMVYDPETGEFSEYVPPEPEPLPEQEYIPSNTEIYENQMIIMSALADIAEMQMGVE